MNTVDCSFLTLFCLLVLVEVSAKPLLINASIARLPAFAGGGFGSKSSSPSKKGKEKNKRSLGGIGKLDKAEPSKDDEPKLDRFGLPIRTAENFFPQLPPDTEIIGMNGRKSTLNEIKSAMCNHIPLNLELFDETGLEKRKPINGDKQWKLKLIHKNPPVLVIENFFTQDECQEYIALSTPKSDENGPMQVDSATFSALAESKRTSTTWFCHFSQVPTLLAKATRFFKDLSLNQCEEPQVVRYRTGEEFSWHYDEVPGPQLSNGGQRVATLLVYLNTLKRGGGTVFRDLMDSSGKELTMQPKTGSALLFFPALADGTPDDRTLHKGEIAVDEKMIAQMWIHERAYEPVVPEGNNHEAAKDSIRLKEEELDYL
jgi:prolyl 4-hydroxylase